MQDMHSVVFNPSGIRASVAAGATVLDAARAGGVDLDSVCGGRGLCGRCQVSPTDPQVLSSPGPTELSYRGRRPLADGCRLGCQALVLANAVIDVPAESQVHRPVVRKSINLDEVVIHPVVTLHYVELPEVVLGFEAAEVDLVAEALATDWGLADVEFGVPVLARLHSAIAAGKGSVTVVVHGGHTVLDVRPGYSDGAWGVAVDVGSTTIAGYLLELASGEVAAASGQMNPQIRFGEDLMSRVSYVMMNPGGEAELTAAVRSAIDDLVGELCDEARVDRTQVHDLVVVGNPIMHHLVLGLDPTPLGAAPFTLATASAVRGVATEIGVGLPCAALYVGPCIAGHVGADAAAAALAEGPHRAAAPMLVVDVGTNAEIVLGDGQRVFAASSPTGPAFEGAQISCGQRATADAVERVRIDPDTWEPRFKVIGCDMWSDEPGFSEELDRAGLQVSGLCGSGIIEVIAEMFLAGVMDRHGVITSDTSRSPRIVADERTFSYVIQWEPIRLSITQNDVRAVQLAKAALRAGIDLLREHSGVKDVPDVRLAGAFGAHIDPVRAMVLGLVPDTPDGGVRAAGNASGVGAVRMLLSGEQRHEVERLVRSVIKIETATEPRFQELFVAAMALPHATDPTPHLAAMIDLPEADAEDSGGSRQRRRHRRMNLSGDRGSPRRRNHESGIMSEARGRRGGGRAGRRAARAASAETAPYLVRRQPPVDILDDEGLELIERNAETILSEVGIAFQDFPEALDLWRAAGAETDGELVRFPPGLCRRIVQDNAPAVYTQHARNPARSVQVGGDATVFAPNYGSPFVMDLDRGRRYATLEDFENVVKLAYALPQMHHSGGTVCEPVDVPVNKRHLDMVYAHLRYSDKPFMGSVTAASRAADSVEMARIAFGGDLADRTVMTSLINASSPMRWDATMLGAATTYARTNQACIISPFILAGAMSPVTVAGLAAQALAEALSGMAYLQLVRPGAPVVFGTFASSMSMATGAPTFGTPEAGQAIYVMASLARRVGVPFRSGGQFTSSKLPDAQAAYESAHTLFPTVQAGVNFVLHAAGWQEGGLALGYEKLILDADQLGAMEVWARGVDTSDNGQAMEAFRTNAHGDHFLGNPHTLANFENAFWRSDLCDAASYEQWTEEGSLSAAQRANARWKQLLADYEPPSMDDAVDAELRDYVARRKAEMPDEIG